VPPRRLSFREIRRRLLAAGFTVVGQKGSHVKFGKQTPQGFITTTVPRHDVVGIGTLRSVLRQACLTWHEFDGL
jgi:predicted RNA binding protein YcfA (HicA-like mRNA interferase family)